AGWHARIAAFATFVSTLALSIQAAVAVGVVLSATLYVYSSSLHVKVVALEATDDGQLRETDPPRRLAGDRVTVLDIYGPLFFAGARTLERLLPEPGATRAVVVLRLRGRDEEIGAT